MRKAITQKATPRKVITWSDLEAWVLTNYYVHLSKARNRGVRNIFRRYFHKAPWYGMPLHTLASKDIALWYQAIKAAFPQEANHCLGLFRTCWKQGQIAGFIKEGAIAPGSLLQKTPANRRERFITPEEMPRMQAALNGEPVVLRVLVRFLLGTACRSGEALEATWKDMDFVNGLWHLAKSKNGSAHTVALTPDVVALLKELPRDSDRLFPRSKTYYQLLWMDFRKTCGLDDVTFHDMRRTRLTWEAARGMPLPDLQRLANHRNLVSTEPYLRRFGNLAPIRAAMAGTAQAMLCASPEAQPTLTVVK